MKHHIAILCTLAALVPCTWGQVPASSVAEHEFPGLQLLPPGSKVKGISLPRYENHRVSALLIAKLMEIATRSEVRFTGIKAELYAENGEVTTVTCDRAGYDFSTSIVTSDAQPEIESPRFSAQGTGVTFSTANKVGVLKGPVKTVVKNSAFNKKPKGK